MVTRKAAMPASAQAALSTRPVRTNGITLNVACGGSGPALLLIHGWPHTWEVWARLLPELARTHTVIAPDLRGIGGSERPQRGYDAATLAEDMLGLLDALGVDTAGVFAIDAGVAPAFLLGLTHSERVSELVLMEGLLGPLPGAEAFLAGGPPWWFGFHAVPGLAERVLAGNEAAYIDFFLGIALAEGHRLAPEHRTPIIAAYAAPGGLRGGLELYRAFGESGDQLLAATAVQRLSVPTLAVSGGGVGAALHGQLSPIADDLRAATIPDCGHVVPLDQPEALLGAVAAWRAARARHS
jgi:pimeloyl-ACP methyl ester carboxylesterase